jgi:hypothetical protein
MELTARDVIMDVVLIALVGIQAFIIMDELSDGKLSRELSVKLVYYKARIRDYIDREETIRRNTGAVIFDAISTVEGAGIPDTNDRTNEGDN